MDGLDVYIEDFSVFEPMSRSMVEQLAHSRETLSPTLPEGWFSPAVPAADEATLAETPDAVSAAPDADAAAPDADEDAVPGAPDSGVAGIRKSDRRCRPKRKVGSGVS
jgi:hypothetical protein